MKTFIILATLMAAVVAAPADERGASVLQQESDNIGVDGYRYSYQTSNGIAAQAEGVLQNGGTDGSFLASRGSYSYTGEDGQNYQVSWVADHNGFQPSGAHLPK